MVTNYVINYYSFHSEVQSKWKTETRLYSIRPPSVILDRPSDSSFLARWLPRTTPTTRPNHHQDRQPTRHQDRQPTRHRDRQPTRRKPPTVTLRKRTAPQCSTRLRCRKATYRLPTTTSRSPSPPPPLPSWWRLSQQPRPPRMCLLQSNSRTVWRYALSCSPSSQ